MSDDFESMKPIIAALADGRPLDVARARKAFDLIMELVSFMEAHLQQEETGLLPRFDERVTGRLAGEMAQAPPHEKIVGLVPWMIRVLSPDDREEVMRMWKTALPEPVFGVMTAGSKRR